MNELGVLRVAVVAAVALSVLVGGPAAVRAEPLIPRSQMLTVDEMRPGMKGVGKSVFRGTRVESFGVTVVGVLRRVDFDGDIILVRIDSGPPVSKGYGVVAGMSGSPVYVDGKLIGAVAYTWPFAKEPIAGVTPIVQMLEAYEPGSSGARDRGTLEATAPFLIDGRHVDRAVVSPSRAEAASLRSGNTAALVPVATPVLVSGVDPVGMSLLRAALEPLGLVPLAGAGSVGHVDTRMVPGQAVGARLVGGDLDVTAIGTITYVKDDVVLAFGHPLSRLGTTDIPLVAAQVHGIMPSADLSFKLASSGQALGRFTEDRPGCVGGRLGGRSEVIEARLEIADSDRGVRRRYGVEVVRNRVLTPALLTAVVAGAMRTAGPAGGGTTRVRFVVEAEGLPRLERENTYAGDDRFGVLSLLLGGAGAAGSATEELSQILDVLQESEFGEAPVRRLEVEVEVSKQRRVAQLERVSVPDARVAPGEEVPVAIALRGSDGDRFIRTATIRVPATCPPGRVRLGVAGGRSAEALRGRLGISEPRPESMAQMVAQMMQRASNSDLVLDLALPTVGIEARGFPLRDLPPAVIEVLQSSTATRLRPLRDYVERRVETEWVVSGQGVLSLIVEGEEKDKGGRSPAPEYRPPAYEEVRPGLTGLLSAFGMATAVYGEAAEDGAGEEEVDAEAPPPMPTWEEVEMVGEGEIAARGLPDRMQPGAPPRGEAVGRLATIWRLGTQKELAAGEPEGVATLSTGGLVLAPEPRVVAEIEAYCVWPVAVASDGSVFTGSWADGRLHRIAPTGETTVVLETEDAAIQAIAAGPDGCVYAAGMPSGTVYRVGEGGEVHRVCELDAQSVWALAVDQSGVVWAGTGPEGRLYCIPPDGNPSVSFQAADRHVTALAVGPDGAVYFATSPRGKVYALRPGEGVRSLCEMEKAAVQSIAVGPEGSVYVGTSPEARVLEIARDGAVRELLEVKARHTLALAACADGTVYAATGPEARVHLIRPGEHTAEVYDPKTPFVAGMTVDRDGAVYLTTADTGRVVRLDPRSARRGSYLSGVCDAGAVASWGAVRWRGDCPAGTTLEVWTRSGGTAHPDETWSPWQATGPAAAASVRSPPNRFLQCRVDLGSGGAAVPQLDCLEIAYLPANQAPEVAIAAPKGDEVWSGRQTIRWSARDPDNDRLTHEVYWSSDRGRSWTHIAPERGDGGEGRPAQGAPADEAVGEQGESEWGAERGKKEPGRGVQVSGEAGRCAWDTAGVGDGMYWVKVVVSDDPSNPTEARRAEAVSRSFAVDNTPPELIVDRSRTDTDRPPSEVAVFEATTYVTSAEFRVDGGEWQAAAAKDGVFDGRYEVIVLDEARLPGGSHEAEVRTRDAAGNVASAVLGYCR